MILKIRVTSAPAAAGLAAAERMAGPVSVAVRRATRTLAAVTSLAMCANSTANLPAALLKPAIDPRLARLEQFFRHYNCPAPQYIAEYIRAADGYGLDYRLLPALSIRETQCGLREKQHNRWGYHPGRQSFPYVGVGIDYVARQLVENPTYRGKTLEATLFTYNPRPAYPEEVKRIMRQIE